LKITKRHHIYRVNSYTTFVALLKKKKKKKRIPLWRLRHTQAQERHNVLERTPIKTDEFSFSSELGKKLCFRIQSINLAAPLKTQVNQSRRTTKNIRTDQASSSL
jgi:hypothetical protein